MNTLNILKCIITAYMIYSIGKSAFKESSIEFTKNILKRFSIKMFIIIVITFIVMMTVTTLLYQNFPILQFGWAKFIFGQNINVTLSATNTGNKNLNAIIGLPFMILFLIAIPKLAYQEEKLFRQNMVSKKQMIIKSFEFGIVHCIMGIPLAMGIGLSIGGALFAYIYRSNFLRLLAEKNISTLDGKSYDANNYDLFEEKEVLLLIEKANEEALLQSTSYHSMWNMIIAIIIIISLFL